MLTIASIPLDIVDWLRESAGVMVGMAGPFGATMEGDGLASEDFYVERYVCVMRRGHPLARGRISAGRYAQQEHVLVTPRGKTARSALDAALDEQGLARRIARTVPSFQMARSIVRQSDLIMAMPERSSRHLLDEGLIRRELPLPLPPQSMKLITHPAHRDDGRTTFVKHLLRDALDEFDRRRKPVA